MDPSQGSFLSGLLAMTGEAPVPRPGTNAEFDAYVQATFGDIDPATADVKELRRAAWRTWKTVGPGGGSSSSHLARGNHQDEDDELARALALSAEEHRGTREAPIEIDDDEEMQRAIAMSTEAVTPHRGGTPDDERRQLEEAVAASLAGSKHEREPTPEDDMEAAIKASLESFKDEREHKRQKTSVSRETSFEGEQDVSRKGKGTAVAKTAGSLRDKGKAKVEAIEVVDPEEIPVEVSQPAQQASFMGGLKIDRAQMERERLARQAARIGQAQPSTAPSSSASVVPSSSLKPVVTSSSSEPVITSSGPSRREIPLEHPLQSSGPFPRDAAGEYYLDGELRHVNLSIGTPSTAPTFSPKDVFSGHSQMSLLIMSSFVWDNQWIDEESILPTPDLVPTIRICRPPTNDFTEMRQKQGKLQPMHDGEVCSYPSMPNGRGSEHMKFAWIFYKTGRLRVAIFTANMVDYDWDRIENTVFIQDFLPKKSFAKPDPSRLPDLPDQFRRLFNHLKINKGIQFQIKHHPYGKDIPLEGDKEFAGLCRYDWSRVKVRIVMSVAGKYSGFDEIEGFGIARVGKIVREEGWVPMAGEKLVAEYQGSSLGSYSSKWLKDFYQCCEGKGLQTISSMKDDKKMPPIKIIFPTLATVDASVNGRPGGGTMFCGSGFKDATRALFHDANSKRGGVLMHTKMIIALFEPEARALAFDDSPKRGKDKGKGKEDVGGWIYVGSHNFSPSAWGTLNFKNNPPTLNISNYELGLMFPLPRASANVVANNVAAHKRPARPYGNKDVPWSQKDHQ